MKYTLVLVRHGESTWNEENRFTGWYDCPLSTAGVAEANAGAKLLKEEGFSFDLAYTSTLQRAIKTLWIILEELKSSEHYPGNDPMYKDVPKEDLPLTESLKITEDRFMVEWEENLVPLIKDGKKIIIAAHGNTLRALVKHLDNISEEEIPGLNIPTGVPLIYDLDEDLKPIPHSDGIAPLTGRYLGNQEEVKQRIGAVAAQTK